MLKCYQKIYSEFNEKFNGLSFIKCCMRNCKKCFRQSFRRSIKRILMGILRDPQRFHKIKYFTSYLKLQYDNLQTIERK